MHVKILISWHRTNDDNQDSYTQLISPNFITIGRKKYLPTFVSAPPTLTAFQIKGFCRNEGNLDTCKTKIGIGIQKGILSEIQIWNMTQKIATQKTRAQHKKTRAEENWSKSALGFQLRRPRSKWQAFTTALRVVRWIKMILLFLKHFYFCFNSRIGWIMAKHKKGIWGAGTDMSCYLVSC